MLYSQLLLKMVRLRESNYDNVNEAGESKVDNKEYDDMMKDKAVQVLQNLSQRFNKGLVDKGAPVRWIL